MALGLLPLLAVGGLCYPFLAGSQVEIVKLQSVQNPTNSVEAILFRLDVDATTSFGYHVSLGRNLKEPGDENTVFIADHPDGDIILRWSGDKLVVKLPAEVRIFKKLGSLNVDGKRFEIEYQQSGNPNPASTAK